MRRRAITVLAVDFGIDVDTRDIRASLFYGAPILSESGACILAKEHEGDHRDAKGARWYVIPLVGGADLDGVRGAR